MSRAAWSCQPALPPFKLYANCIDGQELAANERIARTLEDGRI
jgi:hypothetical protein